jgi:putative SOS response-associated peptidase YedK
MQERDFIPAGGTNTDAFWKEVPELTFRRTLGMWLLFNILTNKCAGEVLNTYTIITTAANELMSEICNTKKRVPVMYESGNGKDWLKGGEFMMQNDQLQAFESE